MILRKNFLSLVLLAPLAKLFGYEAPIDLSKVKLTKIMGTMQITGDAMDRIYGGGRGTGKPDAFLKWTEQYLDEMREESDRFFAYHGDVEGAEAVNRLLDRDFSASGR